MSLANPRSRTAPAPGGVEIDLVPMPVAHLPLIRELIDRLHISKVLDELLPADPRGRVSDSECVAVMIMNILEGRVALYDMQRWLARTDCELLLGAGCPADGFNDTRLAACLDHLADAGTEEVLSGVVQAYLRSEEAPSSYTVHHDTTSLVLHGEYEGAAFRALPARGFSKDHRPDLKQLVFGLALHGPTGMPLVATMFSGNTSDTIANRFHLDALGDLLPAEDDVTLVGDCKLVDAQTLGQLLMQRFHFVSLLPKTYDLRKTLVEEVRAAGQTLPELTRAPGRTKSDPPRTYRGRSFDRPFIVGFVPPGGPTGGNDRRVEQLRFVVVESTQLEENEEEALVRRLDLERKTFARGLAAVLKKTYACETDAQNALDTVSAKLTCHVAHVSVVAEVVEAKRARRGRPLSGESTPTTTVYRMVEDEPLSELEEAVATLRFHARHFVLVTDHLDREAWPDKRVLEEYRHQHTIEGNTGFRWLKNVAAVAPMFLHTPRRIAALGVVFMLALMVRNYLQFELRRRLDETNEKVPDRLGKPTQKPTTETALIPFATMTVVHVVLGGQDLGRRLTPFSAAAKTVLRMLRVDESVFLTPPVRKFQPAEAETPEM